MKTSSWLAVVRQAEFHRNVSLAVEDHRRVAQELLMQRLDLVPFRKDYRVDAADERMLPAISI